MLSDSIGATNEHAKLIMDSYRKWTGKSLLDQTTVPGNELQQLVYAPIIVLSHGTEADPVLNFGNLAALSLWEMDWGTFTSTPSRLTAEPMERDWTQNLNGAQRIRAGDRLWL